MQRKNNGQVHNTNRPMMNLVHKYEQFVRSGASVLPLAAKTIIIVTLLYRVSTSFDRVNIAHLTHLVRTTVSSYLPCSRGDLSVFKASDAEPDCWFKVFSIIIGVVELDASCMAFDVIKMN